jgi:hypothetical protein
MKRPKRCKCCRQVIVKYGSNQKYCSACAVFLRDLKMNLYAYRLQNKRLKLRLYGVKKGSMKIKLSGG